MARSSISALYPLLYGRSLDLPPSPLARDAVRLASPVATAVKPFRRRLFRQRLAVALVRTLAIGLAVAVIILLLRAAGFDLPLPLAPFVGAGIAVLAGLCLLPLYAPSTAQIAHAIDDRLKLHQQVGSALELDPAGGRFEALLQDRALQLLARTNGRFVFPWPSLRAERNSFIGLTLAAVVCAFLAGHAAPEKQLALAGGTRAATAGSSTMAHLAGRLTVTRRPSSNLLVLHVPGVAPLGTNRSRLKPTGIGRAGAARNGNQASGTRGDTSALTLHSGQGQPGNGSQVSGNGGNRSTANTAGNRSGNGQTTPGHSGQGQPLALHLSSGKNSSAGGVGNNQQLVDLRNSINSAQQGAFGNTANTRPQSGSSSSARNSAHGKNGRSGQNGAGGQQGRGAGNKRGPNRNGAKGAVNGNQNGQGAANSSLFGAPSGQSGSSYDEYSAMQRRPGNGTGATGTGSAGASTSSINGSATLSNGDVITLNGSAGNGHQIILSVGTPGRAAANGGSLPAVGGNLSVTTPGYVAPDSNAVAPDDRPLVRSYFSPPSN